MSECLILNDASLPFTSVEDCEKKLDVFFEILHSANSHGIQFYRADDLEGEWNSLIYADGFELGQWINQIKNKDQCLLVKSVIGSVKCPLLPTENIDTQNPVQNILFVLSSDQNIEVKGLGAASVLNVHGVSFASHVIWQTDPIAIIKAWDKDGVVKTQLVNVPNVYSMANMDAILATIEAKKQSNKQYFHTISTENNNDFPHLIFCETVLKKLRSPSITALDFPKIIDALNKLNEAVTVSTNRDELIKNSELNISGESPETMQTPKHERKRWFKHPKLGKTLFEDHVKNFPNNKRMHILVDYTNNTICIGYFGRHLTTVTNPK